MSCRSALSCCETHAQMLICLARLKKMQYFSSMVFFSRTAVLFVFIQALNDMVVSKLFLKSLSSRKPFGSSRNVIERKDWAMKNLGWVTKF